MAKAAEIGGAKTAYRDDAFGSLGVDQSTTADSLRSAENRNTPRQRGPRSYGICTSASSKANSPSSSIAAKSLTTFDELKLVLACVSALPIAKITAPDLALYPLAGLGTDGLHDSPVERSGFEPVWGFFCQVSFWNVDGSLFGAGKPFFVPSPAIRFAERAEGVKGPKR